MEQPPIIATLGGHSMGTTWSVRLVVASQRDLRPLHDGITARLNEIIVQMSTWEEAALISRFNRAPAGRCARAASTTASRYCSTLGAGWSSVYWTPNPPPMS